MISYGMATSASQLYLVSVTYSAPGNRRRKTTDPVDARRANKDWRAFLQKLKRRSQFQKIRLFKVTELTKRLQIHHHLVVSGIIDDVRFPMGYCVSDPDWTVHPIPKCPCIRCQMCFMWKEVTKTSYIVDVRKITTTDGIPPYLTKYLIKHMYGSPRAEMERRGFKRRFSKTNNWLTTIQVRFKGTITEQWYDHKFVYGDSFEKYSKLVRNHPLLERMGTPLALKMLSESRINKYVATIEALVQRDGRGGR